MMKRLLLPSLILLGFALIIAAHPVEGEQAVLTLPISLAVAEVSGQAVVVPSWVDGQVSRANAIFAPHQIAFELFERRPLDQRFAKIETRDDRHALGVELRDHVINWFVVESLRDVDDPSQMRRGVHWRPRGFPGKHFVITSSIAGENVLAHELGHFFGNREHSPVAGNIMSYSRGEGLPFFEPRQVKIINNFVKRFLTKGELRPVVIVGAKAR